MTGHRFVLALAWAFIAFNIGFWLLGFAWSRLRRLNERVYQSTGRAIEAHFGIDDLMTAPVEIDLDETTALAKAFLEPDSLPDRPVLRPMPVEVLT